MLLNVHKHLFHRGKQVHWQQVKVSPLNVKEEQRCWKESTLLISAQNKALAVLLSEIHQITRRVITLCLATRPDLPAV